MLSELFWCCHCHITHAAARRLWQCFCMDLPQLHQKIAIRWVFPIPLETILVRSKQIHTLSYAHYWNQATNPTWNVVLFIHPREKSKAVQQLLKQHRKMKTDYGKRGKRLVLTFSNTTTLLFMLNWKYYTLHTNLNAHTERFCAVSTNLSGKRSHYHFPQTTKAGFRNTWQIRF